MTETIPTQQAKSGAEMLDDLARDLNAAIKAQKPKIEEVEKPKTKETRRQKAKPAPAPDPPPPSDQEPDWAANLSPAHRQMIEDSAITPEVVTARGYWRAH